ncbi:Cytochrome P450 monooxygenase afumB [Cladobotryum mycophilum]|uniref:Cytochrome P450 monooxygenase afumB n=1 Tax=Cladobotryum mycophilum TaxID=491253 RepID=A0ABR0SCU3_9HYPO
MSMLIICFGAVALLYVIKRIYIHLFGDGPKRYLRFDFLGLIFPISIASHFQKRTLLPWLRQLFQKYDGTFVINIVGQDYVFTCDALNIQYMQKHQFDRFTVAADRVHLFKPLSTRGVLTLDGAPWKASREQVRRQLSQYRSVVDLDMHERHIQRLVSELSRFNGEPVDITDALVRSVQDSHSDFVFGESLDLLSKVPSPEKKVVAEAMNYTMDTLAKKGFAGPFHWAVGGQKFLRECASINKFIEKFVVGAVSQYSKSQEKDDAEADLPHPSFIQSLAKTEPHEEGIVIRDQASNVFIAGSDSMASVLCSAMWVLARNSRVFENLRSEIIENCGQEPMSYTDLKTLTYLRYVINETLRLYPPVPIDIRTANRDVTLPRGGGRNGEAEITIAKGQSVVFSSFSTHRWKGIFGEDADEFRPERWADVRVDALEFLPFHVGPRSCPGQQYAMTVLSYTIARIIQCVPRLVSRDDREWRERISMTLGNENGIIVSVDEA